MTEQQARALLELSELPLFQEARDWLSEGKSELALRSLLEKHWDKDSCLAALDCLHSQRRFSEKFWRPQEWLLSKQAAEQATDSALARWRSAYLLDHYGPGKLCEIGSGIGGDSVFLSQDFELEAYEMERARALLCEKNVERLGEPSRLNLKNCEAPLDELRGEILFCDPARRDNKRLFSPEDWKPPLSSFLNLCRDERFQTIAIKAAPGLRTEELSSPFHDCCFVSKSGQLKEALLILQPGSEKGSKRAVLIGPEGQVTEIVGQGTPVTPDKIKEPQPGLFLHNPDPAILRAEALDTLAQQLNAWWLHPKIGYLIGPEPCENQQAASFLIEDCFPLNWKTLKKRLAAQNWSEYEYLGRGVPFSQVELRKRLGKLKKASIKHRGSVIIYREEQGYQVILGSRVVKGNEC